MRYSSQHREETRRKVLDAAGRAFRLRGYTGVGIDGLAQAAGVTSGAFYTHFESKEAAFRAALAAGLDEVLEQIPRFQVEYGAAWLEAFAVYYLGRTHRDDLECGCAMAALTTEVIRFGPEVQREYETNMQAIADLIARGLAGGSVKDRRARSWAFLGTLIGGVNVARAMNSSEVSDEVAAAVIKAALDAGGRTRAVSNEAAQSRNAGS